MSRFPITTLKRFLLPALAGGVFGFVVFLMLTYPIAQNADLPLPPTLMFGSGPRVELQHFLLNLRTDLYWLTLFLDYGLGFTGIAALASVGLASVIEQIETRITKARGTLFTFPTIARRYLVSIIAGLIIGLMLDFAWMGFSLGTVYLHFTCTDMLCSQACLGILAMFVYDELKRISKEESLPSKVQHHITFRIMLAFAAMSYFLYSDTFAWPCAWVLSTFPHSDWSQMNCGSWFVVIVLGTVYTASTLYAGYAFLVVNRLTKSISHLVHHNFQVSKKVEESCR